MFYAEAGEALAQVAREAVASLSLETLKVRLDRALSELVWLRMSLLNAGV